MTTKLDYAAADFNPIKIRQYLVARGWEIASTKRERMLFFRHPATAYSQFYLPMDTDIPGFLRGIEEVLYNLVEFEKRSEAEIVENLMCPDSDIVRYRVCSPQAQSGTISLSVAEQLVGAVTRSLKAAICDVVSPNLHHPRMKRNETDAFLEHTQFAQTEKGSFVVKLLCPLNGVDLPPPTMLGAGGKEVPFVRQITSHLMRTAANLIATIDSGREGQFIDRVRKDVQTERVSADFCRAIANTQIWDDASLELKTQWAPVLKNEGVIDCVEIHRNYFAKIAEIADAITPSPKEQKPELFIAIVNECKGELNESGEREGLVVLNVFNAEGEEFKANVELSAEQYKTANDAHIGGEQHYLQFQGKLIRRSRSCGIIEVSGLSPIVSNHKQN